MPSEEKLLNNHGIRLWSVCSGKGTPLLMCNGGPGCDDYLEPVAAMLEDICTIVRFEPRGCGRSDYDGRYDLDTTVADIEFVRKAYGFSKVIVFGHSAGAGLALVYALRYTNSTIGIIGVAGGRMFVDNRQWSATYHENRERYGEDCGKSFKSHPDVNKIGNESWQAFIKTPTLLRDMSDMNIPAVFINAENDIRPNWPTVQIAHLLKQGKYIEIPAAGHYIWLTHPDELCRELRSAVKMLLAR